MRRLFKLVGEVTLDGMGAVNRGLTSIDKEAKKAERTIAKFGKNMASTGADLTKFVTGPIAALGAGLLMLADRTGKYAGSMLDLKDITGMSTDTLQEMENVARVAGVSFDGLMGTISKLTNQIPEISKGSGPAADAIKKLGVNIYDAQGRTRDMNSLFPELLAKLRDVENVTERNAMAQDIFGHSLADLAPVLGLTTDQFEAARTEAHELGLVMSEDALNAANDYRIAMEKLKAQVVQAGRSIAGQFLPILQNDIMPLVQDRLVPAFRSLAEKVGAVARWFSDLPQPAKETIMQLTAMLAVAGPLLLGLGKLITITKSLSAAVLLLNGALLANPFVLAAAAIGVFAVAIIGAVKQYQNLQKEHTKFKVMTADQAAIDSFTAGVDALIEKMRGYGDQLNDSKKAQELLGGDVAALTEKARALGYVVEGDLGQKIPRLNEVSNALRGTVQELGKGFVTASKDMAGTATQQTKNTKLTEEEIKKLEELKQKRADFAQSWADTYNKQVDDREAALEREYNAAIAQATELGVDTEAIELTFFERRNALQDEMLEEERDRIQAVTDAQREAEEKKREETEKTAEDARQKAIQMANDIIGLFQSAGQGLANIFGGISENNSIRLDNDYQKQREAIENSLASEEEKQDALDKLNVEADKKKRALMRKQAVQDKAAAMFGAVINVAQAITKALTMGFPMGVIFGAMMAGLGAIQLGVIASRPIPMKKGSMVQGGRGGVLAEVGEGTEDEIVFPLKTGIAALADALLEKLQSIELPAISMPQPQFSMAGAGGTSATSGGRHYHFHIGTLIADDSGIKEFERRARNIRIAEDQRRGAD